MVTRKKQNKNSIKFPTIEQLKKAGKTIYALIYCRVSSERQKNEGNGLESQEQRCFEYAKSNTYIVEKVFKDSASGAGEYTSRPGQVEIINHINKYPHKNYIVLVDDSSRLARDVQGHFTFREVLRQHGVTVGSPNFNFDDSEEGEMFEGMAAIVNQYQRKGNRRQVIQKQKARLESGYWAFASRKPYKMVKDPVHGNILKPQYPDAQWLKEAMEGFADGTFVRKVDACRFLVEKGYWKKQSPEKYIDTLTKLFEDPLFAGFIEYRDWEVQRTEGKHKALIDLETFELIQRRLKNTGLGKKVRVDLNPDFPLRGLLCCAYCQAPLTGAWSKGKLQRHPYYFCQNKSCVYKGKVIRRSVIHERFDDLLLTQEIKVETGILIEKLFGTVWDEEMSDLQKRDLHDSKILKIKGKRLNS